MTFGFSIISLWLRCRSILKNRHVSGFGTRINSLDIPFGAQSHQTAITVNEDTNRPLGAPASYIFMYIGNGGVFPGNKCGNKIVSTPFSKGELETPQRKPLETNVETFHISSSRALIGISKLVFAFGD